MIELINYSGFKHNFLDDDIIKANINFPIGNSTIKKDLAPIQGNQDRTLHYLNFSIQLSASRKFPFFTASNIDGNLFKKASRATSWKKDKRSKEFQWGRELYSASKSHFDKGHMTKREDVQWAETHDLAQKAANSTFYYSNAVPQHKDLNRKIWRRLENYILHTETRKKSLKVCVFTGPVLSKNDPFFVTLVRGKAVQIPSIFWKIVIYPKENGKLYRVGFMISQYNLLSKNGIINELESGIPADDVFMQFNKSEVYQVDIAKIEQVTGFTMPFAIDSYKENRNIELILEQIEIIPDLESFSEEKTLDFNIPNLII